jgi:hypothetical protein
MKRIKPGDKVKVYCNETYSVKRGYVRYGEAIGTNNNEQILLHERPDFAKLSAGQFQHFRCDNEVIFLNHAHPEPVRVTIQTL